MGLFMNIDEQAARKALQFVGTEEAKEIERNADLLNLFVGIVNSSLAALEGNTSAAIGQIDKYAGLAGYVGKEKANQSIMATSAAIQISTQTLSLLKLGANATPGAVVTALGAMFTKKVALAFGLAEDNKQVKLVSVAADCASSAISLGGAIATGVTVGATGVSIAFTPIGWVLLGAALAQAGASAYQFYAGTKSP